jgi:hypothetical protein
MAEEKNSIFDLAGKFGYTSPFNDNWTEKDFVKSSSDLVSDTLFSNLSKEAVEINLVNNNLKPDIADGYYYSEDGTFYGKHGTNNLISICSRVEKVNNRNRYYIKYKTKIKYNDLILVAGTAIGESSYGYAVENKLEVYAIANAIMNYYYYQNNSIGTVRSSIIKMKAFAAIKKNDIYSKFISLTDEERNLTFSKEAIGGALNAMHDKSCIDYSNGATHWDGIDIKQSGRKWKEGLRFQEESADIFEIGDNKKSVKQKYADGKYYERIYDYKWVATKGYYGINENKKNLYHPYFEGDKINKNKFGTVLMRLSKGFKNTLKYGEKKVD